MRVVVVDDMGKEDAGTMSGKADKTKRGPAKTGAGGALGAKPLIGIAAGAAVGSAAIAAALIFAGRLKNPFVDAEPRRSSRRPRSQGAPAAFAPDTPAPGGPIHIRDAGPDSVRDQETGRAWDRVDEASDESFPASDPPGH
jgi:hypothetical protein